MGRDTLIKDYLNRVVELKAAILRKEQMGDGGCGITEGLRKELWTLENYPDSFKKRT